MMRELLDKYKLSNTFEKLHISTLLVDNFRLSVIIDLRFDISKPKFNRATELKNQKKYFNIAGTQVQKITITITRQIINRIILVISDFCQA